MDTGVLLMGIFFPLHPRRRRMCLQGLSGWLGRASWLSKGAQWMYRCFKYMDYQDCSLSVIQVVHYWQRHLIYGLRC